MTRVLVVDDSLSNRMILERFLADVPDIDVVGTACDGVEAIRQIRRHTPEIVTLDLEMPHMDGLAFLRWAMGNEPLPVLVVTSRESNRSLFQALELGALDFILKPEGGALQMEAMREELIQKIREIRTYDPRNGRTAAVEGEAGEPVTPVGRGRCRAVAIASSTGGPGALQQMLRRLGPDFPGCILLAQHMPAYSTPYFARRLNDVTALSVREARDGDALGPGQVLVAPGGCQTRIIGEGSEARVRVVVATDADRHVPSGDLLLASAARAFGPKCIGIVLTGMGDDGTQGLAAVRHRGGVTLAEADVTAVVNGMPRHARAAGVVDRCLPIDALANEIESLVGPPGSA